MDTPSPHDTNINSPIGHSPAHKQAHPNVWLLMGHKAGDNNQVLALAEALGWPYEVKRFVYKKTELLSNLLLGPTLAGIRKSASTRMMPPWPDLLITAGRRNEPIARWIQKQSNHSTRIVHIGRPWAQPACFDLIVTTPQYQIPSAPNILCNTLPRRRQLKSGRPGLLICHVPTLQCLLVATVAYTLWTQQQPNDLAGRQTRWQKAWGDHC